jgi:hypothetical protein
MRGSVVQHLILKDWQLHRLQIILSIAGGAVALIIFQWRREATMVIGAVWFFVALILVGALLPIAGIVNERKKQNLAFLMSLPISSLQYTTSKMVSTVGMFLVPWLTLVTGALLLIEIRNILPHGTIPMLLIVALLPFIGLAVITGAALVGESEKWSIAANVVCNSSYGLLWYFLGGIPELAVNLKSPVPVWNSTALVILASEVGTLVAIFGLTLFLQSRKRDFV